LDSHNIQNKNVKFTEAKRLLMQRKNKSVTREEQKVQMSESDVGMLIMRDVKEIRKAMSLLSSESKEICREEWRRKKDIVKAEKRG